MAYLLVRWSSLRNAGATRPRWHGVRVPLELPSAVVDSCCRAFLIAPKRGHGCCDLVPMRALDCCVVADATRTANLQVLIPPCPNISPSHGSPFHLCQPVRKPSPLFDLPPGRLPALLGFKTPPPFFFFFFFFFFVGAFLIQCAVLPPINLVRFCRSRAVSWAAGARTTVGGEK